MRPRALSLPVAVAGIDLAAGPAAPVDPHASHGAPLADPLVVSGNTLFETLITEALERMQAGTAAVTPSGDTASVPSATEGSR